MKVAVILFFSMFFLPDYLLSQQLMDDKELIINSLNESQHQTKPKGGLYGFYKRNISDQIINDCIYEHSCSTFSKGVYASFGLLKGTFLTIDRLTRCNRASASQILPARITKEGRIKDHWEDYARRSKS